MSDKYFDPREYFNDELKARGLTINDCIGAIRRWVQSEDEMSPKVAWAICVMFDLPHDHGECWLNLDRAWQSRPKEAICKPVEIR